MFLDPALKTKGHRFRLLPYIFLSIVFKANSNMAAELGPIAGAGIGCFARWLLRENRRPVILGLISHCYVITHNIHSFKEITLTLLYC